MFRTPTLCFLLVTVASAASWLRNNDLRDATLAQTSTPFPTYIINLDLPPTQRWDKIASLPKYKALAPKALAYLASHIPKAVLPILEKILGNITGYFGQELGGEMISLSNAFGPVLQTGDIVAMNLIMQLESIGLNCSNWNVTGGTLFVELFLTCVSLFICMQKPHPSFSSRQFV